MIRCLLCGSTESESSPSGPRCAVCGWRRGDVPDPDLPSPRIDVVYYLRHADRVKIGTTSNPRQRFGAIWHEELLAFEHGDRHLERQRHARFAADRFERSEWFRLSPALAAHIDGIAAGRDPWQVYARWVSEAYARR